MACYPYICNRFMIHPQDILTLAHKQPVMQEQLVLLQEKEQQIPGSVQYSMRRYNRQPLWNIEDTGMLIYHYKKDAAAENHLELRFSPVHLSQFVKPDKLTGKITEDVLGFTHTSSFSKTLSLCSRTRMVLEA